MRLRRSQIRSVERLKLDADEVLIVRVAPGPHQEWLTALANELRWLLGHDRFLIIDADELKLQVVQPTDTAGRPTGAWQKPTAPPHPLSRPRGLPPRTG